MSTPTLVAWDEQRHEPVRTDRLTAGLRPVAPGPPPPAATAVTDTVLVGVRGTVEVTIGDDRFELSTRDVLLVPTGVTYQYANVELDPALLVTFTATAPSTRGKPLHQPWRESRHRFVWALPYADTDGYRRGAGPHVATETLRGHWAWQPAGQRCRWHSWPETVVYLGIAGQVEFTAAGRRWAVGPLDVLVMPAGTPYVYANEGPDEALYYDIGGPVPPGTKSVYYDDDPG